MPPPFLGRTAHRLANASARAMRAQQAAPRTAAHGSRRSSNQPGKSEGIHWSIYAIGVAALLLGGYSLSSDNAHADLSSSPSPAVGSQGSFIGHKPKVWKADEIAQHKQPGKGVWLAIDGHVYDVERYLDEHPIGRKPLLHHAGEDISAVFNKLHKPGTLARVLAGDSVKEVGVVDPASPPPEPAPWVPPKKTS